MCKLQGISEWLRFYNIEDQELNQAEAAQGQSEIVGALAEEVRTIRDRVEQLEDSCSAEAKLQLKGKSLFRSSRMNSGISEGFIRSPRDVGTSYEGLILLFKYNRKNH